MLAPELLGWDIEAAPGVFSCALHTSVACRLASACRLPSASPQVAELASYFPRLLITAHDDLAIRVRFYSCFSPHITGRNSPARNTEPVIQIVSTGNASSHASCQASRA